jgi:uncharacterized surface protein with fasciclin (FAS1) repeats
MLQWTRRAGLAAMLLAGAMLAGCWDDDSGPDNIVETAQDNPELSLLVEAVAAADLTATLSGDGPLTVFAPTNEAFTALLAELGLTKDQLFADKPLLTAVLTYHVLGAEVAADDIPLGSPIEPLAGGYFKIDTSSGALAVTDGRNRASRITDTDIEASNGLIHIVDKVLLPADKTVVGTAVALAQAEPPEFTLLVEALQATGLDATLNGTGPFTVFAPTDAAFAALLAELGLTKNERHVHGQRIAADHRRQRPHRADHSHRRAGQQRRGPRDRQGHPPSALTLPIRFFNPPGVLP